MKQKKMFALVIMLGFFAQQSTAGSIADSYSSGDTLAATMMDNIKAAVNDNDSRISALETGVVSISYKSFTGENSTAEQATAIVPDAATVDNVQATCIYFKIVTSNYGFFLPVDTATAAGADCDLVAGIQLPHGVALSSFSCTVYDDYSGGNLTGILGRVKLATGGTETVYTTPASVNSTTVQRLSVTTPEIVGANVVDNSEYAYYIDVDFSQSDFSTAGNSQRLYGCTLSY